MERLINWKYVLMFVIVFSVSTFILPGLTTKAMAQAEPGAAAAGAAAGTATTAAITTGTIIAAAVVAAAVVAAVVAAGGEGAEVTRKCVTISGYGSLCEGDNITTAVHHFALYHSVSHATALTHVTTTLHGAGITNYTQ